MKFALNRDFFIVVAALIIASQFIFDPSFSVSKANQGLLEDLNKSVSGDIKSIAVCRVTCSVIPTEAAQHCTYMDDNLKSLFIKQIHQPKDFIPLSHPRSLNTYLIKIVSIDKASKLESRKCFLLNEYSGVEDLYFSKIDAGENCSKPSFEYLAGEVQISNFWKYQTSPTPNNSQRTCGK